MKTGLAIWALFCLSAVASEIVYLEDANDDHYKRNLDLGLPESLRMNLHHSGKLVSFNFRENKRLNANAPIYEPVTDKYGKTRTVRNTKIRPNNKVRYYQDVANGAFVTVECMKSPNGPCTRLLTGNVVLNGKEHKLEPAVDELNKRELPSHLGTPHRIEPLDVEYRFTGATDHENGGKVVMAVKTPKGGSGGYYGDDFFTHPPITTTTASTTTEDDGKRAALETEHERRVADEKLLEKLLERLSRQKRSLTVHGVEMLMVIDHVVYNDFASRYSGDENIKYAVREYFSHIINGVDLRYASIQEDDISIYVAISGFYISNDVSQSPWMNYNESPTNGGAGLSNMVSWRQGDLPAHDHACLITGTDIASNGRSGVVGIAYLNGVCNNYRVSINEELGFFTGSAILAHELGHNLGSYHDSGAEGSPCDPNKQYIMAPYVAYISAGTSNIEPWRFSSCSINEFRAYLSGNTCTLNRAVIYDEEEFEKHTEGLAGQLYSIDEQCELLRGSGSQFCGGNENTEQISEDDVYPQFLSSPEQEVLKSNQDTESVCRDMRCQSPTSSSCSRYVAAHGTPCGNNLMCFEGICQEPIDRNTTQPTNGPTDPPTTPVPTTPEPTTAPVPCDETFTAQSGIIQSPNHPGIYPNNRECVYLINQPSGYRITLTFDSFAIEGSGCVFDYVEVRDGDSANSPIFDRYCGTDMPAPMTTDSNNMYIKFVSDDSVQFTGFKATYEATVDNEGGYQCADDGIGDSDCLAIRSFMGSVNKMCMRFFGQCCQYCYSKKGCKKDKPVKAKSKLQCSEVVSQIGLEQTCTMFPFECCKTCEDLALGEE